MKTLPNIDHLVLFMKIVEAGSFAEAGRLLRIPKPSVSRKVAQLEDEVGVHLFQRSSKGIKATEIGMQLYKTAKEVLGTLQGFQDSISQVKEEPQGRLKITAGVEFGMFVLTHIIAKYSEKFPKVILDVELTGRKIDLAFENIDLAVRIGTLKDSSLKSRRLGEFQYGLFATEHFIEKHKSKLKSVKGLCEVPTLVFRSGIHNESWTLYSEGEAEQVSLNPRVICNNHGLLVESALRGSGVAFTPKFLLKGYLQSQGLVHLFPEYHSQTIPITAVFPNQTYMNPLTRSFLDFLSKELSSGKYL